MVNIKYKDLDGYLRSRINDAVMSCAKIAEIKLKDDIMSKLYNEYNPKEYQRTYDFLESVSLKPIVGKKNTINVMIYYDTSKIIPNFVEDNWNQHEDIWGIDVHEFIPLWLEFGTKNSLWDREGIYAMEGLEIYLRDRYKDMLKKELERKGLKTD